MKEFMMAVLREVSDADFGEIVLGSDLPVLVDFWAPWCGPCRMQGPILEGVQEKVEGRVLLMKLNTDENTQTAQKFHITSIPTLILFQGGEERKKFVGVQDEEKLLREFQEFL